MTLIGTVKNGVIVVNGNPPLTEGATVSIEFESPITSDAKTIPSIINRYQEFIGIVNDLPSDFARNHDHYIHGTPKVDE